jgi:hypothetical protein
MTYLFKIDKKFYQVDININCDKDVLKNSHCVFRILLNQFLSIEIFLDTVGNFL